MLVKFFDSYQDTIERALARIAEIQNIVAHKEAFIGKSKQIDRLYAMSIVMSALVDLLLNDDNEQPKTNENFLQDLNKLINIQI